MKQKLLNMLVALTAMVGSASAQTLSIASIEAEAGTQEELVVKGAGLGGVTALQFNLSLPEGITLDEAAITKGAATNGHELSVSSLDSGERLFVLYSMNLDAIGEGELVRIPVKLGTEAGTYSGNLSTIRTASIANGEAVSHTVADAPFSIIVNDDTGIIGISREAGSEVHEVARYNLQGRRFLSPQRGVNIIRQSDGTTKKVNVK